MNVGGIPAAMHSDGFWIIGGVLLAIGLAVTVFFRWIRWI